MNSANGFQIVKRWKGSTKKYTKANRVWVARFSKIVALLLYNMHAQLGTLGEYAWFVSCDCGFLLYVLMNEQCFLNVREECVNIIKYLIFYAKGDNEL